MGRVIESSPPAKIITSVSIDGLHKLDFNQGTHRYSLDGKRVPGATTVGAVYPKGEGLIKWMIEQGMKEYEDQAALTKGGKVGTWLHKYAEWVELEESPRFDDSEIKTSPYKAEIEEVIKRFLAWKIGNRDTVIMMEELCASVALQAGGMIDSLRDRPGLGLVLGDYKTSKSIYVTHLIQVIGGYRRMMREWHGIDIPYVEIQKFPKQPDIPTEILLCDAHGWTRTVGGITLMRQEIPNLFQRMEDQFERNMGTYIFQKEVDNVLMPSRKKE